MDKKNLLTKGQSLCAGFITFFSQLVLLRQVFSFLDTSELNVGIFYFSWLSFMATGAFLLKNVSSRLLLSAQILFTSLSFFISPWLFNFLINSGGKITSLSQLSIFQSAILIIATISLPAFLAGSAIVSIKDKAFSIISLEAAGSLLAGILFSVGGAAFLSTKTLLLLIMMPSGLFFIILSIINIKNTKISVISVTVLLAAAILTFLLKSESTAVFTGKSTVTFKKSTSVSVYHNGKFSFRWPDSSYLPPAALADYLSSNGKINSAGNIPMALAIHNWRKKPVTLHVSEKQTSSKLASLAGLTTYPELSLFSPLELKKSSLIILPSALPLTVFDNRFLTSEAFDNWKKIVGNDGTIMMSIPVPGTWISKPWLMAVSTLLSTVKLHFKNQAFIDCEGTWLVVSNRQDFSNFLQKVLSSNELKGYASLNTTLAPQLLRAPVSTQENPLLYIYTRAAFDDSSFSKFIARASSGKGKSFVFYKSSYFIPAISLLLLIFIFIGRRKSLSRENAETFSIGTMVFFASSWAMALQIALLINLQRVSGNLIVDAGLISGLFMLFFAVSAQLAKGKLLLNISTPLWVMAISGFTSIIMFFFNSASMHLWITAAISAVSGFLTGGSVSSALTTDDRRGASLVFSWDNAGAAFGSLIAGTILIHISGPSRTVLLMGILAGLTAIPAFISFLDTEKYHPLRSRTWPWPRTSLILAFGTVFLLLVATAGRAPAPATGRQRAGENWKTNPFLHCISENSGKKHLTVDSGVFPETLKLRGYAGPIRMKLTFDDKGTIVDIQIGENIETPSFIKRITPWVQHFRGKGPKDDLYSKETGVDTVSGATMSTKTIRDTVEITRSKVLEYLKLEYSGKKIRTTAFSFRNSAIIVGLFAIAIFLSFFMENKLLRLGFLVVTTITLGFIYNWTISIVDGGLFFLNALPGPPGRLVMVGAAIAIAIIAGPLWCGILCPLGAFQELVYTVTYALGRLIGLYKGPIVNSTGLNNVKSTITTRASFIKYIILATGMVMLAFTGNQKFTDWDPLSWFFSFSITPWRIIAYIMIITSSILLFRPHCRFICPVGAFFSLFNHIALLSRKLGIRKYPDCDFGVKGPSDITCIRCQRCCITKQKK